MAKKLLSKSKLVSYVQCPKRMWLELNAEIKAQDSTAAALRMEVGHQVGEIARKLADPENKGVMLDAQQEGLETVFQRTTELLQSAQPIYEAGFRTDSALAFADILLPYITTGIAGWHMVEVKSTASIKPYHLDDIAIQTHIARKSGVPIKSVSLAHIDTSFVYPGNCEYVGLLKSIDLTEETFARDSEISALIAKAQEIASLPETPNINPGTQCLSPFECGFLQHCYDEEQASPYSIDLIPGPYTKAFREFKENNPDTELSEIPDELLNTLQKRVRDCTLNDSLYFDAESARLAVIPKNLPAYFLDFETINLAIPIWQGARPYQQIPFQFSLHVVDENNKLSNYEFLDLSGNDPARPFAERLIACCNTHGPIFVYNKGFEGSKIQELANRFADLCPALLIVKSRLVDLQPITKQNYYHPSQQGSWSIKSVLPSIAPDLSYQALGVQDGQMAINAYFEAIQPDTPGGRKTEIQEQLLAYCNLDTLAMVRLWQFLGGIQVQDQ